MSKNNKLVFITYKLTKTNILVIFTPKGGSCIDMMVGRGDIIFSGKKSKMREENMVTHCKHFLRKQKLRLKYFILGRAEGNL